MEGAEGPPLPAARAQRIEAIQTVFRTPPPGQLDAAQVHRACTSANTKKAYQSYMNGVTKWVKATQDSADRFFNQDGSLNLTSFTPEHFENFLMYMMDGGKHKVSTLSGYRSALKDAYRQQRMEVPREYMGELKTIFQGLQRVEPESIQDGHERKPGKEPLTFPLYVQLAELSIKQNDNGFIHLFLLTQWNLMCRWSSVETLHTSHLHYSDDSVGFVLHKTKTNQEGSGPKDPRHVYTNPL
ncbi:hypothetical protein F441_23054 [Phytophthora nicotianae CJ01A1]|nr:hypothetical protein F441_23054 [Phytophthora nicotianae CJ01A1]